MVKKSTAKAKDAVQDKARPDTASKSATLASETQQTRNKMADNETSIIEFSQSVADQEAPVPLPVGDYPAEIRGATRATSGAGNAYALVTFFVAPEAYPADYTEGDPDGMTFQYRRVSLQDTPAARHRLKKFTEAIGAPVPTTKLDLNEWVGRTATVTIQHSEYEGEKRADVAKVVAP